MTTTSRLIAMEQASHPTFASPAVWAEAMRALHPLANPARGRGRNAFKHALPEGTIVMGVKTRLDPTPEQESRLLSHVGAVRFAYNTMLTHVKNQLDGIEIKPDRGVADTSKPALLKFFNTIKDDIAPWWAENSKCAYSSAAQQLADALANRFADRRHWGWPRNKTRGDGRQSYTIDTGAFGLVDGRNAVRVPRIGDIHILENLRRIVDGRRVISMTISRESRQWWVSLRYVAATRFVPPVTAFPHGPVGVDLNCGDNSMTLSNGMVIRAPHFHTVLLKKIAKAQRDLARKRPGSNAHRRITAKISRLYGRLRGLRADFRHQVTTFLARTFSDIYIEDLNVKGMTSRPEPKPDPADPGKFLPNGRKAKAGLNRSVLDVGFGEIRRELEYKCRLTGATLHIVDRWHASSKTCSRCGYKKANLPLRERVFECEQCHASLPRDLNAARNLVNCARSRSTRTFGINATHGVPVRTCGGGFRRETVIDGPPVPMGTRAAQAASGLPSGEPARKTPPAGGKDPHIVYGGFEGLFSDAPCEVALGRREVTQGLRPFVVSYGTNTK